MPATQYHGANLLLLESEVRGGDSGEAKRTKYGAPESREIVRCGPSRAEALTYRHCFIDRNYFFLCGAVAGDVSPIGVCHLKVAKSKLRNGKSVTCGYSGQFIGTNF